MLKLNSFFLLFASVNAQLSVTWNGTTIAGPVLIYIDEIIVESHDSTAMGDPNRPGALICRSEDRARVSWHYASLFQLRDAPALSSMYFKQIRTEEMVTPSLSRLSVNRDGIETNDGATNGLWHCKLGNDTIHVGIYSRGEERGSIATNDVSLISSSFDTNPTFTLVGDTRGGPPTTSTWTRNGEEITDGGPYSISIAVNGNTISVYYQTRYRSTLTVTGRLPGFYEYSVTNDATNSTLTSGFNIEGILPPMNLTASQTRFESVQVSWVEPELPPSRGYHVMAEPGGYSTIVPSSPLIITDLQPGTYNIRVSSISHYPGGVAGPVEVAVLGTLPPTINILPPNATSGRASWNQPPFSFTPISYTVMLSRVSGSRQVLCDSVEDNRHTVTASSTSTIRFVDLEEYSTYQVTVAADFDVFSTYVRVPFQKSFTTLSTAPTATPQDVLPSTSIRSMRVTWAAIDCLEQNGPITGHRVELQEQNSNVSISGEVENQTFTAGGLTPLTNYTFRVAGVNRNGTGPYTDTIIITIGEDVPGAVTNLTAVAVTTSVMLTWSPPGEPNGKIVAYEITYAINCSVPIASNTTDISTTIMLELAPNTRVSGILVRAYTAIGAGESAMHPGVTTLPQQFNPPSMVRGVQVKPLSDQSVNVSWEHSVADTQRSDSTLLGYIVYYRTSETMDRLNEQSVTVPSSESSAVIVNLISDQDYQFEVAAIAGSALVQGERSILTTVQLPPPHLLQPGKDTDSNDANSSCTGWTHDLTTSITLTFGVTLFFSTAVVGLCVCTCYACKSRKRKATKEEKEEEYEVPKKDFDAGIMVMKENTGYSSVKHQDTDRQDTGEDIYANQAIINAMQN